VAAFLEGLAKAWKKGISGANSSPGNALRRGVHQLCGLPVKFVLNPPIKFV
jgi:hypothetical protein